MSRRCTAERCTCRNYLRCTYCRRPARAYLDCERRALTCGNLLCTIWVEVVLRCVAQAERRMFEEDL